MKGCAWPVAASGLLKESMDSIVNPHKERPGATRSMIKCTSFQHTLYKKGYIQVCSQRNFSWPSDNLITSYILIQYFTAAASLILVRYFIESDLVLSRA